MNKDKLSNFGYSFQCKLIASLFKDRVFLQQIIDILDPSYFESEANISIVQTIKDYFHEYKSPPTMEVMSVKIKEIDNDMLKTQVVEHLKDSYKQPSAAIWKNYTRPPTCSAAMPRNEP